jgi:hypothetical protein
MLLQTLPSKAMDEIIQTAGASSSPLVSLEVRQLGGELGRAHPDNGALAAVDAGDALYAAGIAPTPRPRRKSERTSRSWQTPYTPGPQSRPTSTSPTQLAVG